MALFMERVGRYICLFADQMRRVREQVKEKVERACEQHNTDNINKSGKQILDNNNKMEIHNLKLTKV